MPGSAMFPFGHLPEAERKALVAHVRRLIRDGLEDQLRKEAKEFGEEVDPAELAKTLDCADAARARPSRSAQSAGGRCRVGGPRPGAVRQSNAPPATARPGKGDGVQEQQDESGMPIRPRDFTRGIFKGGASREQLYARILLGRARARPMPASPSFKPAEVGDLINFIQSLSAAPHRPRSNTVARG